MTPHPIAALLPGDLPAQQSLGPVVVHRVVSVDCTLEKSNPPNALLKAKGEVLTGGHTNRQLSLLLYVMPPADGIQDLHFIVDAPPPGNVVTQVITEVETPVVRLEPSSNLDEGCSCTSGHQYDGKAVFRVVGVDVSIDWELSSGSFSAWRVRNMRKWPGED